VADWRSHGGPGRRCLYAGLGDYVHKEQVLARIRANLGFRRGQKLLLPADLRLRGNTISLILVRRRKSDPQRQERVFTPVNASGSCVLL
jgi:hypothetical protein